MVRKTLITNETENLIAYHALKSGFDIMCKRAQRKLTPTAESVYERLKKGQKIQGSPVTANYRFENYDKSRTLTEGINEFSQRFPQYGEKLKTIIDETRKTKRRYLTFSATDELPENIYQGALESIGIPEHMRDSMLENILEISDKFSKKRKDGLTEILIK
ncbi:MAG: hypothetical protein PF569_01255 [Candidatus Woesearchaeota archaeon]|jgi:hypothetical protein|nr:hypothetical protein [Candidatus Woesearchaeota archaeon]